MRATAASAVRPNSRTRRPSPGCCVTGITSAGLPQPDLQALYMATVTLRRMADGGINDQVGGGFCRYAVDEFWMIPHFEKMLYDNGALLALYAQAAIATGDADYARVALEICTWLAREMHSDSGGFYSSLDADSEGHEGKFYVWSREEVRAALSEDEYSLFAPRYGLDKPANFEGSWHLYVAMPIEELARTSGRAPLEIETLLAAARGKLLALRAHRVRPARDDKILTSWNALAIRGLAVAARALAREELAEAATRALEFIRRELWRDGRLLATSMEGRSHLNAYLDDYVFLIDALIELQQVRFSASSSPSRASSSRRCSGTSPTSRPAASSSPPTITRRSFTAASPTGTTRHPPVTASPRAS